MFGCPDIRIRFIRTPGFIVGCFGCEAEVKRRALIRFGFRPGWATIVANDALHRGQSNACALEIFGPMQPLKDSEQLILILHVEADAIVANEDDALAILQEMTDPDDRVLPRSCELKSVGNKVLKYLLDEDGVALDRRQVSDLPRDRSSHGVVLQQGNDLVNDRIQRYGLKFKVVPANPRQVQQFVNKQPHALNSLFDPLHMMAGRRRHSGTKILGQHAGKAANMAQRGAPAMRRRVGERPESVGAY